MKWLGKWLAAVALCWMLLGNFSVRAEESATVDFVLVMDCTGSLADSDPLKWGIEAAKLFVRTLPTENVRVSIIGFGAKWDEKNTYTMSNGSIQYELVTEAFPLSRAGGENQNDICEALDQIGKEYGMYTQIGYALSAAVNVLEEGKASRNSACIILVSDGRITGQSDQIGQGESYEKYESIESAVTTAYTNDWPIYCLELNYDKLNGKEDGAGKQAREQLNHISESTGGERIEVTGTDTVQDNFTEIIKRYFEAESEKYEIELQDKKGTQRFRVAEMTAETNIIITGKELNRINQIAITDPDGNTKEYNQNSYTESRRITFDPPHHIIGKLISPKPGWWEVTAYGDDGVKVEIQIIPLREVELKLNTMKDLSEGIYRNEEVEFTAYYIYNEKPYSSETFYQESKAYLEVLETGAKFPMVGGTDNYKGTISFQQAGNYTVQAVVEDGIFRNDRKVSESYNFEVKVDPIYPSAIPDQVMPIGSSLVLDCSRYFSGGDSEQVTYEVTYDKAMSLHCDITKEGLLTIEAGKKAGNVEIAVSKKDADLQEPAVQQFLLVITNEKPQILGEEEISVELVTKGNSVLEKLVSFFRLEMRDEMILQLDAYFADPEDLPLTYRIEYESNIQESKPFTVERKGDKCVLQAEKSGNGTISLQAVDCCNEVSDYVIVHVNVAGGWSFFFGRTWLLWIILAVVIFVVVLLLLVAYGGRKIYGSWNVVIDYGVNQTVDFTMYNQGKKQKSKFSELLNEIQPCNFQSGDLMICAGNRINKKVMLKGLDKCEQLTVKKNQEELKGIKKIVFAKGAQDMIELKDRNGKTVRLERRR